MIFLKTVYSVIKTNSCCVILNLLGTFSNKVIVPLPC